MQNTQTATPDQPAEPAPSWEETPAQTARADRDYWVDRDWPTEPDDPSDHYYF